MHVRVCERVLGSNTIYVSHNLLAGHFPSLLLTTQAFMWVLANLQSYTVQDTHDRKRFSKREEPSESSAAELLGTNTKQMLLEDFIPQSTSTAIQRLQTASLYSCAMKQFHTCILPFAHYT